MLDAIASSLYAARLQALELCVLVATTLLLFGLESVPAWRARRRAPGRLPHAARNATLWIVGALTTTLLVGGIVVPLSLWLQARQVGLFFHLPLPWLAIVLCGLLLMDGADYLFHRLSHEARWLWRLHAVHHSDPLVDVTTNVRAHPLHVLLALGFRIVVLAALGFPQWIAVLRDVLAMPITLLAHANVAFPERLDRVLRNFVVTPRMHRIHHSPWQPQTDSNYGGVLTIWDRLFGTYVEPQSDAPERFGLDTVPEPGVSRVLGMLRAPWRMRFDTPSPPAAR